LDELAKQHPAELKNETNTEEPKTALPVEAAQNHTLHNKGGLWAMAVNTQIQHQAIDIFCLFIY